MPKNASIGADGFRMYPWPGGDTPLNRQYNAVEPRDLLSVTSIRTLAGEPFQLVNWKIENVVKVAMGTRKVPAIGKRGGILKGKFTIAKDGPFPGEFVTRMIESRGEQSKLEETRAWLKSQADEPRDVAAVRGSVVHKLIEINAPEDVVDETLIRTRFEQQWQEERRRVIPDVAEDDINFATNAMRQYWDMRTNVPFVMLAQEPQVYNLTAGYGGSADALQWFLASWDGDEFRPLPYITDNDVVDFQRLASRGKVDLALVEKVGGFLAIGDWKTAAGVYTNHVVQTVAYLGGEFVAEDGLIDVRLSDLLQAAMFGLVVHIRPNFWTVSFFEFRQDIIRAFLGSVVFARFLAQHKQPDDLFIHVVKGQAEGTEADVEDD